MTDFLKQISGLSPARLALLAKELKNRLDQAERARTEAIAVVGLSCRFPGDSNTPEQFWQLVRDGRDAIVEVPRDRWDIERYYDEDREAPGKMYAREGGFLSDVAGFDARFFGVSAREAISLDPQHRLLLEVSWEALEHAGWAPAALIGSNTGVFVGITATDYAERLGWAGDEQIDAYRLTGNPLNFAAGRLAYTLGLQGPAMAVDTACSSSLVAIHLACLSLRAGNCRMALAGGVNLILTPQNSVTTCKAQMLSPDGRCKSFDEAADGIGRAEGCGVVVLKKLSDALLDRDHIHLVIRGSSVNQDGRSSGLTVPNGLAQQAVIRAALAEAGVAPNEVSYIEAHGTGTSLGDPIELGALAAVFGAGREAGRPLWVGSVKTNIGHTESAAGVAGLIKVALALRHETIPAHLHLRKPTTRFDWDRHPLRVPREATPWPGARPRIAGISSFGGSGTNAHLVVAEAPDRAPQEDGRKVHALTLSAKTASGLAALERRFAAHLEGRHAGELADICYTTNVGRNHFRHRLTVVAETLPDLRARLEDSAADCSAALWRSEIAGAPPVAFLFTGQGAQYARMGHALYQAHPTYRAALDQCAAILAPELDRPLLDLLFPAAGDEALLDQTVYTQPCLFAVEYALAELWRSWGIEPAFVLGHSLGEYVGACIAGIFSLDDALKLVAARSRLMQALPPDGSMVAVFAAEARVMELIAADVAEVGIAAVNGPENTVISGRTEAVQRVCERLERAGLSQQPLKVSHAFHSREVAPMLAAFEQVARRVTFAAPRLPMVSNVTGRLIKGREASDARYWVEHARNAVRFADGLRTLADQGVRWFLEAGPHPTLSGMAAAFGPADATFLPSLGRGRDDWATLTNSAARLHAAGAELRWSGFHRGAGRCRTALPVYPFERQRFWIDVPAEGPAPRAGAGTPTVHPLLGRRLASPLQAAQFSNALGAKAMPWLADHRVLGRLLLPAAAHIEMAWAAARDVAGRDATAVEDIVIGQALVIPESGSSTTQLVLQAREDSAATFEVFSEEVEGTRRRWCSHATGRVLFEQSPRPPAGVEDLATLRERLADRVEPQALYARLEAHGFAFGARFRNLVDIRRSGHEALGRARLEGSLRAEAGSYRIHPALLDACLQVFAVAAHEPEGAASSPIYLPLSIERLELFGVVGDELFSHARFRSSVDRARDTLTGDLDLYDAGGGHVGQLRGLHLKRIDPASFGAPLRPAWRDWLYTLRWRESPPAQAVPLPDLAAIAAAVEADVASDYEAHGLADYNQILPELDTLCAEYIIQALRSLGDPPAAGTTLGLGEVVERYGIQASQRPLTARLLDILAEDGLLQKAGTGWQWGGGFAPVRPDRRAARLRERHAAIRPEIELLERCGGHLAEVLQGKIDPLQLLFPAGGLSSAEKIYGESPFARFYASLIRKTIAGLVAALPPSAELRVLEIGGGTGGTTSAVLPELPADRTAYTFTDISAQFTKAARQKFAKFPFVDYRLLDIGRDPAAQGFPPGAFDLVIAANVLHATRDLRQTMRCVRQLLRPGGALLLLETTRPQRYGDLTVGFTEGWWLFSDRDLRPDYPLLDQARWRTLLGELAFSRIAIVPGRVPPTDKVDLLAQQSIIIASVAAAGDAVTAAALPVSRWLVFGDEDGLGKQVHEALTAAPGSSSVLAKQGACHEIIAPDQCRLSADDPGSFDRLLRAAGETQPVTGIVYLWGLDAKADESATADEVGAAVRRACAGLLQVVRACAASGLAPRLWVCTRGAEAVLDAQASVSAEQATLWGLGRVIALEHPEFECVRIDLDPAAAPDDLQRVLATLAEDGGEDQLAWRGAQRWLPRLEPYVEAATPAAGSRRNGFDADGSYLVTGGLGGLGLRLASWMAEKGARSLVLMGRTPPGQQALEVIAGLRAKQIAVEIALGDVGDPSEVARTLAAIARAGRPLRGVFHAAGELDDGALVSLGWDRFRRVMNAKVAGTWNLHRETRDLPLDHFVLFSSATGLLGSPGQGNHAAANAYLDAIAELRRRQGLPAISIDWGAWSRIGAAARRQVGERVAVQGIGSIEPEEGMAALEFLLQTDPARVAVIPIDWPRFLKAVTGDRIPAFLRGWLRDTNTRPAGDTVRRSGEAFRERFAAAPAGRKPTLLLELVRTEVARVLGWRPDEPIELRQPFTELGLDSLMAVELRNSLGALLQRSFPATILFDHPTVEALAAFLLHDLTGSAAKPVAEESTVPGTSSLDDLSEAELAEVLASKLAALSHGDGA